MADEPELTSSAVSSPSRAAKFALELLGEAAGGEPEIEAGVDGLDQFVGVEDAAGVADDRFAGDELPRGEGLTVVFGDEAEDLIAFLPQILHHIAPSRARERRRNVQGMRLSSRRRMSLPVERRGDFPILAHESRDSKGTRVDDEGRVFPRRRSELHGKIRVFRVPARRLSGFFPPRLLRRTRSVCARRS